MRLLLMYFILSISFLEINAQIDTNDVYPLQIGNIWEYASYTGSHFYEIVVDSVEKPNGKTYAEVLSINLAVEADTFHWFWRTDRDEVFVYYGGGESGEFKMFDTGLPVGSAWITTTSGQYNALGEIISFKEKFYYPIFDAVLTYIFEDDISIQMYDDKPPDTNYVDTYRDFLKGVGRPAGYNGVTLIGAIINGKRYGNVTVGVEEPTEELKIMDYNLSQNYPNPFNPTTTICYSLKDEGRVTLKIFNTLGEEIRTLVNTFKQEGKYEVTFDGSGLPSGVYIYRINVTGSYGQAFTSAKKLVLLK